MSKTLVVVESPSKVKKIQSYLGDNYIVTSSMGHFRGLDPKKMSKLVSMGHKRTMEVFLHHEWEN